MDSLLLLLAQHETALEGADKAIDIFDKLGKAGPVTIALAVAFAAVAFAVFMMRKNWKLQHEHATELKSREVLAKKEADDRLKTVIDAEKDRRESEKDMLREMIERGHEATQALEENNKIIASVISTTENMLRKMEEMDRRNVDLQRTVDNVQRSVDDMRRTT